MREALRIIIIYSKYIILYTNYIIFAGPLGHEACESFGLRNLVNYLLGSNSTGTILNEVVDF